MADTPDIFKQSMDQMAALTRSFLRPANTSLAEGAGANAELATDFVTDLQALYADAYRRHLDPLLTGNPKMMERFNALTRSRDPQDFQDFQLEMLGLMMEGASVRAEIWGDLADKVGHRYADFVRAMAAGMNPAEPAKPASAGDSARRAGSKAEG